MLFIQSWWNRDGTSTRRSFLLLLSSILKPTLYRCLNPQKIMGLNVENVAQRKSSMLQKCDYYQFTFLVIFPTVCRTFHDTFGEFVGFLKQEYQIWKIRRCTKISHYESICNQGMLKIKLKPQPKNSLQHFQLLSGYTFQQAEWLQGFFIETLQGWVVLGSRWSFSKSRNCIA